jgi:hypothetical protein
MTPWYTAILAALVTGLLGWAAQAWAKRGQKMIDHNQMAVSNAQTAMGMATEALKRIDKLEIENSWRQLVDDMKDRYVLALIAHINNGFPPPPPTEPVYPPRPT